MRHEPHEILIRCGHNGVASRLNALGHVANAVVVCKGLHGLALTLAGRHKVVCNAIVAIIVAIVVTEAAIVIVGRGRLRGPRTLAAVKGLCLSVGLRALDELDLTVAPLHFMPI